MNEKIKLLPATIETTAKKIKVGKNTPGKRSRTFLLCLQQKSRFPPPSSPPVFYTHLGLPMKQLKHMLLTFMAWSGYDIFQEKFVCVFENHQLR